MRQLVYWDSNCFLGLLNQDKSSAEMAGCQNVWQACEKGIYHIVTSTLTTAEVIYVKNLPKLDQKHRDLVSNYFRQDFISQKSLTREIAELARDVVWDSNIKPKDAIHVATCAFYKIRELHTFDNDLVSKKTINVNHFVINVSRPIAKMLRQSELPIEHPKSFAR